MAVTSLPLGLNSMETGASLACSGGVQTYGKISHKLLPPQPRQTKIEREDAGSCFVCNEDSPAIVPLSAPMLHSRAPLTVALTDLLGYSFHRIHPLHSKGVCSGCFASLGELDSLQLQQAAIQAHMRRLFSCTVSKRGLDYQRNKTCSKCKYNLNKNVRADGKMCRNKYTYSAAKRSKNKANSTKSSQAVAAEDSSSSAENNDSSVGERFSPQRVSMQTQTCSDVGPTFSPSSPRAESDHKDTFCGPNRTNSDPHSYVLTNLTPSIIVSSSESECGSGNKSNSISNSNLIPDESYASKVFDNDPVLFGNNECLCVGDVQRRSSNEASSYRCQYCRYACKSAMSLKMHVRIKHAPVIVYSDTINTVERDKGMEGIDSQHQGVNNNYNNNKNLTAGVTRNNNETLKSKHSSPGVPNIDHSLPRVGVQLSGCFFGGSNNNNSNNNSNNNNKDNSAFRLSRKTFVCLQCDCCFRLKATLLWHHQEQHSWHKFPACSPGVIVRKKYRNNETKSTR